MTAKQQNQQQSDNRNSRDFSQAEKIVLAEKVFVSFFM